MEKALILDLDGTLIDSVPDIAAVLGRILEGFGRPPLPVAEVVRLVGSGLPSTLRQSLAAARPPVAVDDADFAALRDRFLTAYEAECAVHTRAYDGVAETLPVLAAAGWRMAVCTNKHTGVSLRILDALRLATYFELVAGVDAVPRSKPDPGHVMHCLTHLKIGTNRAVVVGDSEQDLVAAAGAGVAFVAVDYGYGRLTRRQAPLRLTRFADLPRVLADLPVPR